MGSNHSDESGHQERRRHKRTHVLFTGRILSGNRSADGVIMDLSASGARVELSTSLEPNQPTILRLAGSVDFAVEIAWRNGTSLGLRFREVPGRISAVLAGLLPEDCLASA